MEQVICTFVGNKSGRVNTRPLFPAIIILLLFSYYSITFWCLLYLSNHLMNIFKEYYYQKSTITVPFTKLDCITILFIFAFTSALTFSYFYFIIRILLFCFLLNPYMFCPFLFLYLLFLLEKYHIYL